MSLVSIESSEFGVLNNLFTIDEDSLRLAILSAGDGRARRAGRRVVAPLGCVRSRCNCAHWISQSSYRRRTARVSPQIPAAVRTRADRRRKCRAHLAASFSESKSARENAELQFVLCIGGEHRSFPVAAGRCDCELPAGAGRPVRLVAGAPEASPLCFRSARSLA